MARQSPAGREIVGWDPEEDWRGRKWWFEKYLKVLSFKTLDREVRIGFVKTQKSDFGSLQAGTEQQITTTDIATSERVLRSLKSHRQKESRFVEQVSRSRWLGLYLGRKC